MIPIRTTPPIPCTTIRWAQMVARRVCQGLQACMAAVQAALYKAEMQTMQQQSAMIHAHTCKVKRTAYTKDMQVMQE